MNSWRMGFLEEKGVSITLTKTSRLNGNHLFSEYEVKNGRVWLYRMDTLLTELTVLGKGKFSSKNFTPKVGEVFSIKAIADGLDTLVSKNIIFPSPPSVKSYKIARNDSLAFSSNNGAALFTAQLQDDIADKNVYMISSYLQITVWGDSLVAGV